MGCLLVLPSGVGCNTSISSDSFAINEIPPELPNCARITFSTLYPFVSGSLKIYLDGKKLDPSDYSEGGNLQSFTLNINPSSRNGLNSPPASSETITVDYIKTQTTLSSCIKNLY